MDKDALIEVVARAICADMGIHNPDDLLSMQPVPDFKTGEPTNATKVHRRWQLAMPTTLHALKAINDAGLSVVPNEATEAMVKAAPEAVHYRCIYSAMVKAGEIKA